MTESGLVFRAPTAADTAALTALMTMPGVQAGTARAPGLDEGWVRERVERPGRGVHAVVGLIGGDIVSWATIVQGEGRRAHSGDVSIVVREDLWGQGVGRATLGWQIALADEWLGLRRSELDVLADNRRAIRLYESAGFVVEGRRRGALITRGVLKDVLVMARLRDAPPLEPEPAP